ncbi:MAG: hypothetical protein V3S14_16080 [Anaerolineae bacterium]
MTGELTEQSSIKIILAGHDEHSLTRNVYPAMTAAGFDVLAVVDTPEKLRDVASAADTSTGLGGTLAIVEANIASTPDAALELLSALSTPFVVILPAMWAGELDRFADLSHKIAGLVAPVSWPDVIADLPQRIEETEAQVQLIEKKNHTLPPTGQGTGDAEEQAVPVIGPTPTAPAAPQLGPQRSKPIRVNKPMTPVLRIGFYGTRGGVGTSTAVLTAARALAGERKRVALFDASRRGDAHLMAGIQPTEQPVVHENVTFFMCSPSEQNIQGFDAVIVDGGRTRGTFNASWVVVSKPLPKDKVLRLVGIEPHEDENAEKSNEKTTPRQSAPQKRRKRGLGKLISIEVTE